MVTKGKALEYPAVFSPNEEGGYDVSLPDFPGCVTFGKNLEEAREKAVEVLELWLEEMQEEGEEIPQQKRRLVLGEVRVSFSGAK